jgi:hypothetical protein
MITITKTKSEMKDGSPHRIVTVDIDLEDIRSVSKTMTSEEFYKHVGKLFCKNLEPVMMCKVGA